MLVSLIAVYLWDNTIFDDFQLPVGMNRETLLHELLRETAELSLIYSDPIEVKSNLKYYSAERVALWTRLWELSTAEYNPLDNYQRTQTETTEHGHRENSTFQNSASHNSNVNNKVFGFDSDESVGKDTSTANGSGSNNGTQATQHSGTDTVTITGHGNIGVTSYQQMIEGELSARPKLDIYKYIIEDLKHNFCVMIY